MDPAYRKPRSTLLAHPLLLNAYVSCFCDWHEPRHNPTRYRMRLFMQATWAFCFMSLACQPGAEEVEVEQAADAEEEIQVCPTGTTLKGIDVSEFQGSISWAAVRQSGVRYAFIRASDGTSFPDDRFDSNWAGSKNAGVIRGAYQFFRANQDPVAQANLLLDMMGDLDESDLPPVLDVETANGVSGTVVLARARTWLEHVAAATGRTPIIYTSIGFWETLPVANDLADYPLWVANYGVSCPNVPSEWDSWKFWQSADNGVVPGISGPVDVNAFNGTLADLQGFIGAAKNSIAMEVYWARQPDGHYDLRALGPSQVDHVEYRVDGFTIGAATRLDGDNFPDLYTFSTEKTQRRFEVIGFDAQSAPVARGVGSLDVTAGTAVYIKQMGERLYEIGLERPPAGVAAIEVRADGILLPDSVSGLTRSTRKAVRHTFSQLGAREFRISTFNANGTLRGTITRSFTLE